MKKAYNEEALNRIASQDKLDKMLVLVSPAVWTSILGAFIVLGILFWWGFYGKLPETVEVSGIYTNSDGTTTVYSQSEGFVTNLYVKAGDIVVKGDVIANLGTQDDIYELRELDQRIQYVENMTFDSELDQITADTEKMAEIKLNAKNSINDSSQTKANLEMKKEKLAKAKEQVDEKESAMLKYKEEYFKTLNISDERNQIAYNEANNDYDTHYGRYESYKSTYISAQENYNIKREEFDARYEDYDYEEHSDEENQAFDAALADVESARTQAEDSKYFLEEEEKLVREANTRLETARKNYLEYLNANSGIQAQNVMANTEYSEMLQDYIAAKNSYKALVDEIDELEIKAVVQTGSEEISAETSEQKFDNEKSLTLHELQIKRDSLLNKAEKGTIKAEVEGVVYEVPLEIGQGVNKGTIVASMLAGDVESQQVICYVKLADAKKIHPGMSAYVYPSTVDKQEYGHINARINTVGMRTVSTDEMGRQLGSNSLVNDFQKEGSVIEVTIDLIRDSSTKSGYKWSAKRGNDIELSSGTLISSTIITEEKRPIDLLIPYLKKKFDFEEDENATANK